MLYGLCPRINVATKKRKRKQDIRTVPISGIEQFRLKYCSKGDIISVCRQRKYFFTSCKFDLANYIPGVRMIPILCCTHDVRTALLYDRRFNVL